MVCLSLFLCSRRFPRKIYIALSSIEIVCGYTHDSLRTHTHTHTHTYTHNMSTSNVTPFPVYIGAWINWSHGPVMGATLTLGRSQGNLLIAFIAFFVGFVGTRFWRMLCLATHFYSSSQLAKPGIHHQRQATLRNSADAAAGLWELVCIAWAWKSKAKAKDLFFVMAPAILLAILCAIGFAVASGFSSQISSAMGNEVLLRASQCGYLDDGKFTDLAPWLTLWRPYASGTWIGSSNYARECYRKDGSGFLGCDTFVQRSLPFTVNASAACPFPDPNMCVTQNANILLDSGLLDSHEHFGLNSRPENRVQWRKVMHCAPLVTEGFKTVTRVNGTNTTLTRYHYGRTTQLYIGDASIPPNMTYEYRLDSEKYEQINLTRSTYSLS